MLFLEVAETSLIRDCEFRVLITENGKEVELPINKDGSVGKLTPGRAKIKVTVPLDIEPNLMAFSVNGYKTVYRKKEKELGEDSVVYSQAMDIRRGQNGTSYTLYGENNIRLVELDPDKVTIYEATLVSQNGFFFFIVQKTHESWVYKKEEEIIFSNPQIGQWEQFLDVFLEDIQNTTITKEPTPSLDVEKKIILKQGEAKVEWFNVAHGSGCLKMHDGKIVRVHWSQLEFPEGEARYLLPGKKVRVKKLEKPMETPNKKHQTRFQWEAKGVSPVK